MAVASVEDRFPTNCWYVAGATDEIAAGAASAVTIAGNPIVLFRAADATLVALEDRCVHRHAPLSLGRVEAAGIRCMYHGLLFGTDGKCIEIPGQDIVPPSAKVVSYPIVEQYGWVWIWIGDPSLADHSLVPPAIAGGHSEWTTAQSHIDYAANYELIVNNLLDFSHLSYVHAVSFRADIKWATTRPTISTLPRGVRISRWITDAPALASARSLAGQPVDTWQSYDFLVPGILLMETWYCRPGSAALANFERPQSGVLVRNSAFQAVTATTARSTRYFFAVALPAEDSTQDVCDEILKVSRMAFEEDRAIIEAQQERIDMDPQRAVLPTAADRAITMFNGVLRKLNNQN